MRLRKVKAETLYRSEVFRREEGIGDPALVYDEEPVRLLSGVGRLAALEQAGAYDGGAAVVEAKRRLRINDEDARRGGREEARCWTRTRPSST
jgi:hypothetical protein